MELEPATPKTPKSARASQRLCLQGGRGCAVHRQKIEARWSWPVAPQLRGANAPGARAVHGPAEERAAQRTSGTSKGSWWVHPERTARLAGTTAARLVTWHVALNFVES